MKTIQIKLYGGFGCDSVEDRMGGLGLGCKDLKAGHPEFELRQHVLGG